MKQITNLTQDPIVNLIFKSVAYYLLATSIILSVTVLAVFITRLV
ncbi:MAG TPA: hypothetical protein VGO09_03805 [Flavisolibacter sp.]|nr:hypothetical protein [Flavisolibacter sp.]